MRALRGHGLWIGVVLALTACERFPDLEETETPGVAQAPYPALLPIDQVLAGRAPTVGPADIAEVEGRAEGLRGRADRLGSVPAGLRQSETEARLARLRQRAEALRDADI